MRGPGRPLDQAARWAGAGWPSTDPPPTPRPGPGPTRQLLDHLTHPPARPLAHLLARLLRAPTQARED